jgi:tetratricopeptide (TPR) repeat protein
MSVRLRVVASVCSAFLAASAAVSGAAAANSDSKLVSQAYKALQVGDAAAAVQTYTMAIESRSLEPEVLANAFLNRGLAYQRLNEHERAVDDYTAAMRIDAMSAKLRAIALYNRGLSYQRLQRNAMAMEDFTSALFLDGQFSHAYYSRGVLLRDSGQYLFALADFDKALRYKYPDLARVHFAEAIAYEKLRRPSDARDALTLALAAKPNYEPALQRLAILEGRQPARVQVASADQISTGAVSPAKQKLPAAAAPPAKLVVASTGSETKILKTMPAKKLTDRVPVESAETANVVPAAAPAPSEEKVLAVEPLNDAASEAPAVETPAEAATPAAADRGWAVQIASAVSEDAAWSVWKRMKARHKALSAREPIVVRADLGDKGIFYRVRFVFDNKSDAGSECSRLKSSGVACFVSRASS